jgi:hypothetical protein
MGTFSIGYRESICSLVLLALSQTTLAADIPDRLRDAIATASPGLHPELRTDRSISLQGPHGIFTIYADNVQKQCVASPDQCSAAIQQFSSAVVSVVSDTQNSA